MQATKTKLKATPAKEKIEKSKAMQDGIKAIIYLQSLAGIVETPAQAARGWIALGESGQRATMNAYRAMTDIESVTVMAPVK